MRSLPHKRKKASFLLIEVLIAVAIIGLCVYPLLAPHIAMAQAEIRTLERSKLERLADQTYVEIVEGLFEGYLIHGRERQPVTWKDFTKEVKGQKLNPVMLAITSSLSVEYSREYEVARISGEEKSGARDDYRLLEVTIRIHKKGTHDPSAKYVYHTIIQKGNL
jgi:hypothetical protein